MLLLVNKKEQVLDKNKKSLVNKNKKGFDVEMAYSESKRSTTNKSINLIIGELYYE